MEVSFFSPCIHTHTLSMNATFLCFVTWVERGVFCAVNTALRGGDGTMLKRGLCDQEMWPATISHIRWVCTHWQASYALNLAPWYRRHARMAWAHNWEPHSEMPGSHSNWFARNLPQKLDGILWRIRDQEIGAEKICFGFLLRTLCRHQGNYLSDGIRILVQYASALGQMKTLLITFYWYLQKRIYHARRYSVICGLHIVPSFTEGANCVDLENMLDLQCINCDI